MARMMPSGAGSSAIASIASVGRREVRRPSARRGAACWVVRGSQAAEIECDSWVWPSLVLQHERARAMQHADGAGEDRRGVGLVDAVTRPPRSRRWRPRGRRGSGEETDRVGPAADTGRDRVGSTPYRSSTAGAPRRRSAHEAEHQAREQVRPGGGAEEVGGVVDAGTQSRSYLVRDRVLRVRLPLVTDDLGTEQLHAGDVERLALGVDLAHVDRAVRPRYAAAAGRWRRRAGWPRSRR